MVVLFVVLTILVFLTIDYIVQKVKLLKTKTVETKYRRPLVDRLFGRKARISEEF